MIYQYRIFYMHYYDRWFNYKMHRRFRKGTAEKKESGLFPLPVRHSFPLPPLSTRSLCTTPRPHPSLRLHGAQG